MAIEIGDVLPETSDGTFIGRVYDHDRSKPVPVAYRGSQVWDLSQYAATVADLFDDGDYRKTVEDAFSGPSTWQSDDICLPDQKQDSPLTLLSPIDLQAVKACGVTFAGSMVERVIEERAQGNAAKAAEIRNQMEQSVGIDLANVRPGTEEAEAVKKTLVQQGWWSQYLEVGLGPFPEVFTKAQPLSSVGAGADIGIPSFSAWNNPEPELGLIVNPRADIVGVTLGNDVNLRDIEGRSALLLGMAKDNNRSTAIGPFIRLFDESFSLDDARQLHIELVIHGSNDYELRGVNTVSALSRSFEQLVQATIGPHHQYPDGCLILTGTLFAPTQDRSMPGEGFTHEMGDIVTIHNPSLGSLINTVGRTEELSPWTYGIRSLFSDLAVGTA